MLWTLTKLPPEFFSLHLASSSRQALFVPVVCFFDLWRIKKPLGINIWTFGLPSAQYPLWCPHFWVGGKADGDIPDVLHCMPAPEDKGRRPQTVPVFPPGLLTLCSRSSESWPGGSVQAGAPAARACPSVWGRRFLWGPGKAKEFRWALQHWAHLADVVIGEVLENIVLTCFRKCSSEKQGRTASVIIVAYVVLDALWDFLPRLWLTFCPKEY